MKSHSRSVHVHDRYYNMYDQTKNQLLHHINFFQTLMVGQVILFVFFNFIYHKMNHPRYWSSIVALVYMYVSVHLLISLLLAKTSWTLNISHYCKAIWKRFIVIRPWSKLIIGDQATINQSFTRVVDQFHKQNSTEWTCGTYLSQDHHGQSRTWCCVHIYLSIIVNHGFM